MKELGPDQSNIIINQQSKDRGRQYTRSFSRTWVSNKAWLTACSDANALFCFPCLLFQTSGSDPAWINTGMTDLKHCSEKAKKHQQTTIHMENAPRLGMLGRTNISCQLDEGYRMGILKHKQEVDNLKNFFFFFCLHLYS